MRVGPIALAGWIAFASACASVSESERQIHRVGDRELTVAARAERGLASDRLVVAIDGVDVAEGPFGPDQVAGTLLRGTFEGMSVEARCGHRWRPGVHIGYRCHVSVEGGEAAELDF